MDMISVRFEIRRDIRDRYTLHVVTDEWIEELGTHVFDSEFEAFRALAEAIGRIIDQEVER